MLERPRLAGVRLEAATRSLGRKTESEVFGAPTVAEGILAENTVLDQLQSRSNSQPSDQSAHQSNEFGKDNQDLTALLREDTFSGQLNGIANGLGEVAVETVQGVAELGVSGVQTIYDLLLGSAVNAVEEMTDQDAQLPEWAPDSERGVERLKAGAGVIAEIVANPGLIVDAVAVPIKQDWNQGRYGEAFGRGLGELVSVTVGAQGANKLLKGAEKRAAGTPSIMDWSPEKAPPWPHKSSDSLLGEINKIRDINPIGAESNCINCAIMTELSMSGHPASAIVLPGIHTLQDVENIFSTRFGPADARIISKSTGAAL